MISIKRILYLFVIIALLAMSPGGGADQANFPDIYIDGASGGDGSLATPYSDFASINWTTGGDNSVFDAVAADKDVTINLKKGVTWREQLTVGCSGSAAHPITIQAYGSGADPIISGSDLVVGWTAVTADDVEFSDGFESGDVTEWVQAGTEDADEESKYTDTYGYHIDYTGSCRLLHSFSTNAKVKCQFRFKLNAETLGDADETTIMSFRSTDETKATIYLLQSGGNIYLDTQVSWSDAPSTTHQITVGDWYTIAVEYFGDSSGHIKLWVDGSLEQTVGHADTSTVNRFYLGTYGGNDDDQVDVYYDDVYFWMPDTQDGPSAVIANVWKAACATEPKIVFFDGTKGTLQASAVACTGTGHWFWESNVLYIYYTEDPDGAVVIGAGKRNSPLLIDEEYITIDGIYVTGGNGGGYGTITIRGDNVTIQNCDIKYTADVGILASEYGAGNSCAHLTIDNCEIYDADGGGIYSYNTEVYPGGDYATISNNDIQNCGSTGIANEHYGCGHWLIENNYVKDCSNGNGLQAHGNNGNNVIRYNEVDHSSGEGGGGISVYWGSDNEVYGNIVYGCRRDGEPIDQNGIIVDLEATYTKVYYNISYDNDGSGVLVLADNCEIYNNVLYANGQAQAANTYGNIGLVNAGATNCTIKNNICYDAAYTWEIYVLNTEGVLNTLTCDYNCIYRTGGGSFMGWGANTYSWADWLTNSSQDANSINTDPLMTDPGSDDFTLQVGSPCINRGTFVGLILDYLGLPVPIGHRPDIGAYEHKNGGAVIH